MSPLDREPAELSGWIGKSIRLETVSGLEQTGKCLSVDPVSGSVVIIQGNKLLLLPSVDLVSLDLWFYGVELIECYLSYQALVRYRPQV